MMPVFRVLTAGRRREFSRRLLATFFTFLASSACIAGAQAPTAADPLQAYESCKLSQGLSAVGTAPLATGIEERTVPTRRGTRAIPMLAGRRVMFAYPGEDFYANIKVEAISAENWADARAALQDNFDYILASGDDLRNYKLKPQMHGFDLQGQDRAKREGGVLGLYLLFDGASHTVATIYFLNQEPPVRFKTMEEYGALRDRFLEEYTACLRGQKKATPN